MQRPAPEEYEPPLTRVGEAWRLLAALALSIFFWLAVVEGQYADMRMLLVIDIVLGAVAFVVVLFRRRWPIAVAVVLNVMAAVSALAGGPAVLAAVSLATRRRVREIVPLGLLIVAGTLFYLHLQPVAEPESTLFYVGFAVAFATVQLAWGMYLGSRRELYWQLRARAELAEAERDERAHRAREQERARIAREMHDVLAHRITQVSMTAGALAFRDDLGADSLREGLGQVQERANQALQELRGVLGVLRDEGTGEQLSTPQPTYDDVSRLVEEAVRGGMNIDLEDRVDEDHTVPDVLGRAVYRIVQEGLTNVGKHAPGALLHVRLSGDPDSGLAVELRNALGFGHRADSLPGYGLVGLAERAEMRGGHLRHRVEKTQEGEQFVVEAWLPWGA